MAIARISMFRAKGSFGHGYSAAEKYDSDACVVAYKDTIDDILDYYGVDSQEDLIIPVADKEVA